MGLDTMINIKKINIELILSLVFSLLVFLVALKDTQPIWSHLHFFGNFWSFEIGSTWGMQMVLIQNIVLLSMVLLVVFIVVIRIRQIKADR